MRNTQEVEKFIELEQFLKDNILKTVTIKEGLDSLLKLNTIEKNYLILAYLLPKEEIEEAINLYDNTRPRVDELLFVHSLSIKYNVDKNTIIKRIQQVRRIMRYEENLSKKSKKTK